MPNKKALYCMKWKTNDTGCKLALQVQYVDGNLEFYDTVRGHRIPGKITKEDGDGFDFTRTHPDMPSIPDEQWRFDIVTLDMWKRRVRDNVDHNRFLPEFSSTEDLWEYYRRFLADQYGGI